MVGTLLGGTMELDSTAEKLGWRLALGVLGLGLSQCP